MKPSELIAHVNRITDENLDTTTGLAFLNDGMAKINTECNANFPFLSLETDTEPVIPEKWQRLLLCVFAAGRVKEADSSQFEYMDFYGQFDASLNEFKAMYKIPDEYKDSTSSRFSVDVLDNSPWGW